MNHATRPGRLAVCVGLMLFCVSPTAVRGDAVVISQAMKATTIAEIFIEEGQVRVELEIGVADLAGFRNLIPDEVLERIEPGAEPLVERLPRFFSEDFTVRVGEGGPLPGRVTMAEIRPRVRRDEITGEPLPASGDEEELVFSAILVYPLAGRPSSVSVKPPIDAESGMVTASIGFVAYHLGVPMNDFRYLGLEETADLDWQDAWYSRFRRKNLWRQYNSPMSVFIYVEPFEVRVEIISRPMDLQTWLDLGLAGETVIPASAQPALKEQASAFFAEHLDLTVDGEPVVPVLDRINFLRRTLRTSSVVDPPEDLDLMSATLGVIFVLPTDGLPQEATLVWDLFSDKVRQVQAAGVDEAGPLPWVLTPEDNVLHWQNYLTNPTIPSIVAILSPPPAYAKLLTPVAIASTAAVLLILVQALRRRVRRISLSRGTVVVAVVLTAIAGVAWAGVQRARMSQEETRSVMAGILHNVYLAFDYRDEELIYDTLTRSISGDLLTRIYLEMKGSLELQSQGGARVKVKAIDLLETAAEPVQGGNGFVARSKWNVTGSVGHWGHVHTRTNQYHALVTVRPVDSLWKITELEILQEERLQ